MCAKRSSPHEFDWFTLNAFGNMAISVQSMDSAINASADPLRRSLRLAASKREPSLISVTDNRIAVAVMAWLNDGGTMPVSKAIELLSVGPSPPDAQFTASYFRDKFGIPLKRIDTARRSGRLKGERRGGRWLYSLESVKKLWSDDFDQAT